jgi:hypothetical protein
MSEADLQRRIMLAIGAMPGVVCMRNALAMGTRVNERTGKVARFRAGLGSGSADLILCVDGRFAGLEVKMPGQKPRQNQREWADAIRATGGFACSVTSEAEAIAAIVRLKSGANQ